MTKSDRWIVNRAPLSSSIFHLSLSRAVVVIPLNWRGRQLPLQPRTLQVITYWVSIPRSSRDTTQRVTTPTLPRPVSTRCLSMTLHLRNKGLAYRTFRLLYNMLRSQDRSQSQSQTMPSTSRSRPFDPDLGCPTRRDGSRSQSQCWTSPVSNQEPILSRTSIKHQRWSSLCFPTSSPTSILSYFHLTIQHSLTVDWHLHSQSLFCTRTKSSLN